MIILFLTNNENTKGLFQWLKRQESTVYLLESLIDVEIVERYEAQMIISYNYNYLIKKDVIDYMQGNIINLHISFLPWNRGSSPNLWSFIDDTPKGVSIHYINEGLDTGDIIIQKEIEFETNKETFVSTYEQLHIEIQKLFIENWELIKTKKLKPFQQKGIGSYHKMKELKEFQKKVHFSWDDNIESVLNKYKQIITEG